VEAEFFVFYPLSFIAERRKNEKGSSPLQDEPEEDVLDEETQALDAVAVEGIKQIINNNNNNNNKYISYRKHPITGNNVLYN
jgi:ABC-type lipopolysaccharide export system ATPase subunit